MKRVRSHEGRPRTQCKEDLKVKQGLLTLAALSLAVAAAVPASAQINTSAITIVRPGDLQPGRGLPLHPRHLRCQPGYRRPARPTAATCPPQTSAHRRGSGHPLPGQRKGLALDVNCFAVVPDGQSGPCFVQAYQLTKEVPGSFKCPDVYGLPALR